MVKTVFATKFWESLIKNNTSIRYAFMITKETINEKSLSNTRVLVKLRLTLRCAARFTRGSRGYILHLIGMSAEMISNPLKIETTQFLSAYKEEEE